MPGLSVGRSERESTGEGGEAAPIGTPAPRRGSAGRLRPPALFRRTRPQLGLPHSDGLDAVQELVHRFHEEGAFLVERRVRTLLEDDELGTGDARLNGGQVVDADLVVAAAHDEGRHTDLAQAVEHVPVAKATRDGELAGPFMVS